MLPRSYSQGQKVPPRVYVIQPQQDKYIDLTAKQKCGVSNLVSHKEKIFFAGVLPKVNKRSVVQHRIIVITNNFLYNINPDSAFAFLCGTGCSLQRQIPINKIYGATVSVNPTSEHQQFVIHVQGEYDYLFNGGQKREKFFKFLLNAHFANSAQPFLLYCRDESNLSKFHTTDEDLYNKVNKRPKDGQILVTREMAQNGIEWVIFNRRNFIARPNTAGPVHSLRYPQLPGPGPVYSPPPTNFPGPSSPQNPGSGYPGYPVQQPSAPQWGGPGVQYGMQMQGPMSQRPSYYIPEFSAPMNQVKPVNQGYQGNQGNGDFMQVQRPHSASVTDLTFIPRNVLTYNSNHGPNPNVQIQTNFDSFHSNGHGQQQNLGPNNYIPNNYNNNYGGYNYTQNPNVRGPNM